MSAYRALPAHAPDGTPSFINARTMPHIVVEYTPNLGVLPFDAMLASVTRRLAVRPEIGDEADLKARVVRAEVFRVGPAQWLAGLLALHLRGPDSVASR